MLEFIGMYHAISEMCYKGTILQWNYRSMTISSSYSYNFFVKFQGKRIGATTCQCYIQFPVIMRCALKEMNALYQLISEVTV